MYPRILPTQVLDITDVIQNGKYTKLFKVLPILNHIFVCVVPRTCTVCGEVAQLECKYCFRTNNDETAFCKNCYFLKEEHKRNAHGDPDELKVPVEFMEQPRRSSSVPRVYMELFAVVCIDTSHYVAFVKTGSEADAPWLFFDSMADRQGGQNGHNVPKLVSVEDLPTWISDKGSKELHESANDDKHLPPLAKRLLCDASICMYQNRDVMMYQ